MAADYQLFVMSMKRKGYEVQKIHMTIPQNPVAGSDVDRVFLMKTFPRSFIILNTDQE